MGDIIVSFPQSPGPDMQAPQNTTRGILLFLLATGCIVLMNACVRMFSQVHGPVEMVFYERPNRKYDIS